MEVAVKVLAGGTNGQQSSPVENDREQIGVLPSHRQRVKDMAQEIRVASRILSSRHPNLPLFFGACFSDVHNIKIVYELIVGQNLEQIVENKGKPEVLTSLNWSVQLFCALSYLHSANDKKVPMVHRDVKPSNIMVSQDLSNIKLVDFGLCIATQEEHRKNRKMSGKTGSFRYMSPEVMLDKSKYTDKVDVYSAAMVLWYVFMGVPPQQAMNAEIVAELAARVDMRPPLQEIAAISPVLASILDQGWSGDEVARLDSAEMLSKLQDLEKNMLAKEAKRSASIYNKLSISFRRFSEQFFRPFSPGSPRLPLSARKEANYQQDCLSRKSGSACFPSKQTMRPPGGVGVLALGLGGGDLLKRSNSQNDLPTPAPALSLDGLSDSLLRRSISDLDLPASREFL